MATHRRTQPHEATRVSSPMKDQRHMVSEWLERVFNGDMVPQFEMTDRAVSALYPTASQAAAADADAEMLAADLEQRAAEYQSETTRLDQLLATVGIPLAALSSQGMQSVQTLAHVADALNARATDQDTLLAGLSAHSAELATAQHADATAALEQGDLEAAAAAAEARAAEHAAVLERIEEKASVDVTQAAQRRARLRFLDQKIQEYSSLIRPLEREIREAGYEDGLSHSALVHEAQRSAELAHATQALSRQVATYSNLPADISLAAAKLEQARRLNASLDVQLQSRAF